MDRQGAISLLLEAARLDSPGHSYAFNTEREETQYDLPSEDERRLGGAYTARVTYCTLVVGAKRAFSLYRKWEGGIYFHAGNRSRTVEEAKDFLRSELLHQAKIAFGGDISSLQAEVDEIWAAERAEAQAAHEAWEQALARHEVLSRARAQIVNRMNRSSVDCMSVPEVTPTSSTDVHQEIAHLQEWIAAAENLLEETLRQRGIEAQASALLSAEKAAEAAAAREKAMSAPAAELPWLTLGGDEEKISTQTGRKPGQGFGNRLEGSCKYLPGGRQLVVREFGSKTARFRTEIFSQGVECLWGDNVPSFLRKVGHTVVGLVEPGTDWYIAWLYKVDEVAYEWGIMCHEGWARLEGETDWKEEIFTSSGWEPDTAGPSERKLRSILGLGRSKRVEPTPAPAPAPPAPKVTVPAVAATTADLAAFKAKFAKKK